ncbi:GL14700 [Drosophila persimilis]|uniref:GL14700 n=1 Tax=Drosophila persimilis TaxID=7234 RepID=B4GVQ4_DROPE|nr:uncharacterized protein LOC6597652 [Drosophila persimilis]EDW26749.1 GL14700 [Drosophila persimilis]
MKRVSALFRPAVKSSMSSVSLFSEDAGVAPVLKIRRSVSHSVIQSVNHFDKETNRNILKNRLTGSGSELFRGRNISDANKSRDAARGMPHTEMATAKDEQKTTDYREYARYRNTIREENMWRDPRHPETNWLKPRSASAYKPDFANTENNIIKQRFMRSPDEKSKHMLNHDLTQAVQKLRFIPSPAPMSATAQVVRQAAEAFKSLPKAFENKTPSEKEE